MSDINFISNTPTAQSQTAKSAANPQTNDKARAAAEEFEAFFLSQFLETMTAGVQTDDTFGGGESEKIFRSLLNDEYSRSMSKQGGIGIADAVYRDMLALQEI